MFIFIKIGVNVEMFLSFFKWKFLLLASFEASVNFTTGHLPTQGF